MNTDAELRHIEQQMAMARPWDTAEPESIWEITGAYPGGKHSFTACLAMTVPQYVTGTDEPLFCLISPAIGHTDPIVPAWITHARPLLLVHRDEPTEPYWEQDRAWLPAVSS